MWVCMCDAVQFKKKCEQMIGVVSQCMVKPRNLNIQYLANLALKINLKVCTIIIAFALVFFFFLFGSGTV
jgi:hypothetical protein